MHIASLVKIPCYLLKLSSGNENMGVSQADNSVKIWQILPISNPKPDLHNINAHTKFVESPLMFTQVIIRKRKMDRQTDVRQTDGHIDVQRETIIPCHYCEAGYKKNILKELFWGWLSIIYGQWLKLGKLGHHKKWNMTEFGHIWAKTTFHYI